MCIVAAVVGWGELEVRGRYEDINGDALEEKGRRPGEAGIRKESIKQILYSSELLHLKTNCGLRVASANHSLEFIRRANFRRRLGKLNPCPVTSAGSPARGPPAETPLVRSEINSSAAREIS